MSIGDLITALQQAQSGKKLQGQHNSDGEDVWIHLDTEYWFRKLLADTPKQIRVAPEPREFWCVEINGRIQNYPYYTQENALKAPTGGHNIVHFREVL